MAQLLVTNRHFQKKLNLKIKEPLICGFEKFLNQKTFGFIKEQMVDGKFFDLIFKFL
jgi:hypothetical protein